GTLAALGYDAEWHCIPASAVGAPHRRDRAWIIAVADAARVQPGRTEQWTEWQRTGAGGESFALADADIEPTLRPAITRIECDPWEPEPDVGRVAHGVPARVDRLRGLGNAVVPQIPELIGRAILGAIARA